MNQIYFATSNDEKVRRLMKALDRNGIKNIKIIQKSMNLPEPRSENVLEVAKEKLRFAYERIKRPCVVRDSGFFIDSLNGFPRTYINFALETIGVEGILKLVKGKDRGCRFEHCLSYYDGQLDPMHLQSISKGKLADRLRGLDSIWPLHMIFIPNGENRTIAEMSEQELDSLKEKKNEDYYTNQFAKWISKF